jgi:hypothetical protein
MSPEKTKEECKYQTEGHIGNVRSFLNQVIIELSDRSIHHDASKLQEPEFSTFCKYTPLLADLDYGSEEYKKCLAEMKPALDHHYSSNRHHPEHFYNSWRGMNLIDLLEMVCDWMAATKRHNNGNIYKSLAINQKRFKMPAYLVQIIKNTVDYLQAADESEQEEIEAA